MKEHYYNDRMMLLIPILIVTKKGINEMMLNIISYE